MNSSEITPYVAHMMPEPKLTFSQLANSVADSLHRFAILTERYLDILTSPTLSVNEDDDSQFKKILGELVSLDQAISEKVVERKNGLLISY